MADALLGEDYSSRNLYRNEIPDVVNTLSPLKPYFPRPYFPYTST